MSEEKSGDKCEVCASESFIRKFCDALNGGEQCRLLTEQAGRGEMTQEEYFAKMIELFGRDKVAKAFDEAMVKDRLETVVSPKPEEPKTESVETKPSTTEKKPEEELDKGVKKKLGVDEATAKELREVEKELKGAPRFKTSIKGACLPCIGEPASAILSVVALWYTGDDKAKIRDLVKQMRNGEIYVEDAIKEVLKMDGGQDCYNEVLKELNRITELAVDNALKEKPELAKKKKE